MGSRNRKACASSCQTMRASVALVRGRKTGESVSGSTSAGGLVARVKYGRPKG